MERILAMVKSAGETDENSHDIGLDMTKTLLKDNHHHNVPASTSNSDDTANSVDWEGENTESGKQLLPYKQFFDSREKKLQDKIEFVRIVQKHKSQLFGDCDGHEVTARSKEEAWKKVANEIEDMGLESFRNKPWARLRDHDWQYVRRHALSRSSDNVSKATGKLGELDTIVLEIISTTALANSVNTNSSLHSQASSQSQQSTDSVEQYFRNFLGGVPQHNSAEIPEIVGSFEKDETIKNMHTKVKTEESQADSAQQTESSLDILNKVTQNVQNPSTGSLSVDSNHQLLRQMTKSPIPRKITMRSSTAPSVYSITSSTNSPPQSTHNANHLGAKRPRTDSDRSPGQSNYSFEQKKEALFLRKLEAEVRHAELMNEKIEVEIRVLEGQERRTAELHSLEMRAAKARLLRGSAIDEPSSVDMSSHNYLSRQSNGYSNNTPTS